MKAIVVTDKAAGTAGMTLVERPEPPAAINDVIVQIYASGFVPTELAWPSTWTDRANRDRTPSIPGHELAGVVSALGYGTTGVSVGQRVLGLADWHREGTWRSVRRPASRSARYSSLGLPDALKRRALLDQMLDPELDHFLATSREHPA